MLEKESSCQGRTGNKKTLLELKECKSWMTEKGAMECYFPGMTKPLLSWTHNRCSYHSWACYKMGLVSHRWGKDLWGPTLPWGTTGYLLILGEGESPSSDVTVVSLPYSKGQIHTHGHKDGPGWTQWVTKQKRHECSKQIYSEDEDWQG